MGSELKGRGDTFKGRENFSAFFISGKLKKLLKKIKVV